ncbi:MAG: glycosyltransferase family 2 protein [Desulfobacteraceae bacterium]
MSSKPRVSIGLPVYNGERFLKQNIESILAQTFEDFELIISDNASTDRTEEICRQYAAQDGRIRYYRNAKNLGAAQNFNRVFELSSGEFFKWMPADSALEPEFLARCVSLLDNEPDIILAWTRYILHNEVKNLVHWDDRNYDMRWPKAHLRVFIFLTCIRGGNMPIWGLMRSDVLRQTQLIRPFVGADDCLLLELAIKGQFEQLPDHLMQFTRHFDQYSNLKLRTAGKEGMAEARWYDSTNSGTIFFPYWRRLREFLLVVMRSDAGRDDKLYILAYLMGFAMLCGKRLSNEVFSAIKQVLNKPGVLNSYHKPVD